MHGLNELPQQQKKRGDENDATWSMVQKRVPVQWVADSAYPITLNYVPVIKGENLSQDEKDFSKCLSHVRVCSVYTIGVWKGSWAILQNCPSKSGNILGRRITREPSVLPMHLSFYTLFFFFLPEEGDKWDNKDQSIGQQEVGNDSQNNDDQDGTIDGVAVHNTIMGSALTAGRGPRSILTFDQQQQRRRQLQQKQQQRRQQQQQ